ncbi:DUF1433 domain-containing protein [Streptococcus oralis]|uniref:Uncharacterized protein n=1 Tax=Streptococcus oralis TaxID=1303 RepID=A0A081R2A7_STROR|nr:hypothetical protein [Streptococcus oralis]KEQ49330.1 hypothetical protein SK143_2006 [Streptococcus oralis]MCY7068679.1 DUF1433 domain-containing protein [Streptococcus oralis]MCY7074336.1 DUF1433 domain-containing protein [Streptococcus oralis]MCY7100028.1 DUF1433 domain-containing protein [Streptococcus oralis]ORO62999.1 hypothetical protein B7716_01815 [Streptococcus oralis subsp. oralis]
MKKRTLLWLVLALVVFGGGAWMAQETNLFGGITLSPRAKQLAYLKEHEEDMADFVKALSPKVESVQFDWDSMKVEVIGNGTPQGGGYIITLDGRINNNKDTEFTLGIPLKRNSNEVPEELVIYEMQPIRILRDGGWFLYD